MKSTKKPTAKALVIDNADTLRTMSHGELFRFSREHGFDSRAGFSAFRRALASELSIDYTALRSAARAEQQNAVTQKATRSITLFSDAKASHDRFAICDRKGNVVWYGRFFDGDRDYNGEQSSGEMAAAKKAVWFASRVAKELGDEAIRLTLFVDANWLCYANDCLSPNWDGHSGGKARRLADAARKCKVVLSVEHVPGTDNPADAWTTAGGFKKWSDNDLVSLCDDAEQSS